MTKQLRTQTEYDFGTLVELQRVVGGTITRERTRVQRCIRLAVGVLALAGGFAVIHYFSKIVPAVVCIVLGAVFLLWGAFFYQVQAWTAGRAMGKNRRVNEFVLEKGNILAFLNNESARYAYEKCDRLLEAERCIYVILENGQGLMLDKRNVQGGSSDDLRQWLEEKTGKQTVWVGRKKRPDGKS